MVYNLSQERFQTLMMKRGPLPDIDEDLPPPTVTLSYNMVDVIQAIQRTGISTVTNGQFDGKTLIALEKRGFLKRDTQVGYERWKPTDALWEFKE